MGTAALVGQLAQLNIPMPYLYGYVRGVGNEVAHFKEGDGTVVSFVALGEGECDGIERLWVRRTLVDYTDTSKFHFHPGTDGELGHGLAVESNGGDQRVDNFWSEFPANAVPVTLSRKCYLAMKVGPDALAPSADLDWLIDLRGIKCRKFDNAGAQTGYAFTTNPAWVMMDLILRRSVKPEQTINEALTSDEKARFDFASLVDTEAACDYDIGGGKKRAEISMAIARATPLVQVLEQMRIMSRTYIDEKAGKLYIRPDKPRAYSFTLTSGHILPNNARFEKKQIRGAANQYFGIFNDLNPIKRDDIDTVGNTGASRTLNVVTIKVKNAHGLAVNDWVEVMGVADTSFNGLEKVTVVVDSKNFKYNQTAANATSGGGTIGTPESRFTPRSVKVDHKQHQMAIGQRGVGLTKMPKVVPIQIDFGNNTWERVSRMLEGMKVRLLGDDSDPYLAPMEGIVKCFVDAVDGGSNLLSAFLRGDIVRIDKSVSEQGQGDYEITDTDCDWPNLTLELTLKQYKSGAFTDTADEEPATVTIGPPS